MTMQAHILRAAGAVANSGAFGSYGEFLAYISSLTPYVLIGSDTWSSPSGFARVTSLSLATSMTGTSWGKAIRSNSSCGRIVQHGLPSEAVWDSQLLNSGQVLINVQGLGQSNFQGLARNGYTSESYGFAEEGALYCQSLVFWDFLQGAAFEMNPYSMTGPFPWDGTI